MVEKEIVEELGHIVSPETDTPEQIQAVILYKWRYSQPFKQISWEEIQQQKGQGIIVKNRLMIDNGQHRSYFDKRGHEVRREKYTKINPDSNKPHLFDISSWQESTYDNNGYLVQVSGMSFGIFPLTSPGFVRNIEYAEENGRQAPSRIITQHYDRQGVMDLGLPTGQPVITDLTRIPLIFPEPDAPIHHL